MEVLAIRRRCQSAAGGTNQIDICALLKEIERRCPGGKLPSSYIVLDLETTGLDPLQCRAVQYGACIVRNNLIVDTWSVIVNYPYQVTISSEAAQVHKITPERMRKEGVPMGEFIPMLTGLMHTARSTGTVFLGHNFGAFDRHIIERDTSEFAETFRFGENEFIDTGGLVKAAQLVHVEFEREDTLASFFTKVRDVRAKGVRWSLEWCVGQFGLVKEGADTAKLHDAGMDARTVHLLYQSMLAELSERCKEKKP